MNEQNNEKINVNFINGIIKSCCLKDIDTGHFFSYDGVLYFKSEREDEDIETHEHSYLCYAIVEKFSNFKNQNEGTIISEDWIWINESERVFPMDVDINDYYIYEKENTFSSDSSNDSKYGLSTSDWGDNYL